MPITKELNHIIKFRIFKEERRRKFTRELSLILWEEILISRDVNTNFDRFISVFYNLYNSHFSVVTKSISSKRMSHPWITPSLINAINFKNTSLNDFRMGLISWDNFKIIRNRTNAIIKASKRSYYINLFNNFKNNTKKLWESLNTLNKSPKPKSNISNIISNNKLLTRPVDIANEFNSYFANVGSKLDEKLPPAQSDPMEFMTGNYPNSMQVPYVTLCDVTKIIKSLKNKKCHIDDYAPFIIKENVHLLSQPISFLFNQSVATGTFPKSLKCARIIPLHKKGPKSDINNYRPISLLNIFSKIFEKL